MDKKKDKAEEGSPSSIMEREEAHIGTIKAAEPEAELFMMSPSVTLDDLPLQSREGAFVSFLAGVFQGSPAT